MIEPVLAPLGCLASSYMLVTIMPLNGQESELKLSEDIKPSSTSD